jgi:hypothetical protein
MIITILAEPRSGSTNLLNWFFHNKDFTIWFLPSDYKSKWYIDKPPSHYKYITKFLLIKEDYYHYKNYQELIEISDKVILLYRENEMEQIESWINAKTTNNWDREWKLTNIKNETEISFFKELKQSFKDNYLDKSYFKISYEELYYSGNFQKLLDYLNVTELENKNFPYGKKYRIKDNIKKYII